MEKETKEEAVEEIGEDKDQLQEGASAMVNALADVTKEIEKKSQELRDVGNVVVLQDESSGYFYKAISSDIDFLRLLNYGIDSFKVMREQKKSHVPSYIN